MINTVTIIGRLTAEPELKQTQSGISVLSFTAAVDRNTKDKQTDFIKCVSWRQTAEFISQYFGKGQMIALRGRLQQRSYEDRDGNKRSDIIVVADEVSFCGSKNNTPTVDADFEEIPVSPDLPF